MKIIVDTDYIRIGQVETGGSIYANAYLITCPQKNESVLIDAPGKADVVLEQVKDKNVKYILMTHNHSDHTGALIKLKSALRVPVCGNAADALKYPVPLDIELGRNDRVIFGDLETKVFQTPGHTPGSLCYLVGKHLFTGDTIFPDGPGYTESPECFEQIINSIVGSIFTLSDETVLYPGHGNSTTLGKEKEKFKMFSSRSHSSGMCGDVLWLES